MQVQWPSAQAGGSHAAPGREDVSYEKIFSCSSFSLKGQCSQAWESWSTTSWRLCSLSSLAFCPQSRLCPCSRSARVLVDQVAWCGAETRETSWGCSEEDLQEQGWCNCQSEPELLDLLTSCIALRFTFYFLHFLDFRELLHFAESLLRVVLEGTSKPWRQPLRPCAPWNTMLPRGQLWAVTGSLSMPRTEHI